MRLRSIVAGSTAAALVGGLLAPSQADRLLVALHLHDIPGLHHGAAPAGRGGSGAGATGYACPVAGRISSGYGRRGAEFHDGVDLAAPLGTPIYAVAAGVVTHSAADDPGGYGQYVNIRAGDGSTAQYGHMRTREVRVGQRVAAGQEIARVGAEGEATGPHLHLRIYPGAARGRGVDPAGWLAARGVQLPCRPVTCADLPRGIRAQESGGDYRAVGALVHGDRAQGAYQVMGDNIPAWSREVLGHPVTVSEWMASPRLQDRVALAKLGGLCRRYGPRGAASAWFSGRPGLHNDPTYRGGGARSVKSYVDNVIALAGKAP